jgi:hypothetical protein
VRAVFREALGDLLGSFVATAACSPGLRRDGEQSYYSFFAKLVVLLYVCICMGWVIYDGGYHDTGQAGSNWRQQRRMVLILSDTLGFPGSNAISVSAQKSNKNDRSGSPSKFKAIPYTLWALYTADLLQRGKKCLTPNQIRFPKVRCSLVIETGDTSSQPTLSFAVLGYLGIIDGASPC